MSIPNNTEKGGKEIKLYRVYEGKAVTFTASTGIVGLNNHGLKNGDKVVFTEIVTTTGITEGTSYFARDVTANGFKVAATKGGSALALTGDGTGEAEIYPTVGGMRSKSIAMGSESIDVSSDDSNEWRRILNNAGQRTVSISGSGVFSDDAVLTSLRAALLANTHIEFIVQLSSLGDYFRGVFKVTSLEQAGEYNGEMTYSLSLESSDEVVFVPAA